MKLRISSERHRIIIIIIVLSVIVLTDVFFLRKQNKYVLLFPQYKMMTSSSFQSVSDELGKTNFRYKLVEDDYCNLLIHPDDRTKALLMLANLGLPAKAIPFPNRGPFAQENTERSLMKEQKEKYIITILLGTIDHSSQKFKENLNGESNDSRYQDKGQERDDTGDFIWRRVLEERINEFETIFSGIDGVDSVDIKVSDQIVCPGSWKSCRTAIVRIKTKPGIHPDNDTISGIKYLLSYYVAGLEFDCISVEE